MSKAQHTPGPWGFLEEGCTEEGRNAGEPLTICSPKGDDLANIFSADDSTVSISRAEAVANARLIAAAPEMLEALKAAVDCGMVPKSSASDGGASRHSEQVRIADQVRAAIAKAEGR